MCFLLNQVIVMGLDAGRDYSLLFVYWADVDEVYVVIMMQNVEVN